MAWIMATGGSVLNPALVETYFKNSSSTQTYTYDSAKRYLISASKRIAGSTTTASFWFLDKGSLKSEMGGGSGASVSNNTSTSTLTLTAASASQYTEWNIIRLD